MAPVEVPPESPEPNGGDASDGTPTDPWERRVYDLLADGNIREAKRLATETWDFEVAGEKLIRLNKAVKDARQRDEIADLIRAELASADTGERGESETQSWPPPVHDSRSWSELKPIEQEQLHVFVAAGPNAVLEVPALAEKARGREKPNRHDWEAAVALDGIGLTEKVGGTGRRLISVPKGMPQS